MGLGFFMVTKTNRGSNTRKAIKVFQQISYCLLIYLGSGMATHADEYREGYRLVSGDTLAINHSGLDRPVTGIVDINGQIRLDEFGPITVRGLELDQAVEAVTQVISAADLFLDPRVDIALLDHAEVVVGGDVAAPGRYSFQPGMMVDTAIAIAGGLQRQGRLEADILHLRADLEAQLRQRTLEIETHKTRTMRINAAMAGAGTFEVPSEAGSGGLLTPKELSRILSLEQRILDADNDRTRRLLGNWEREIAAIEMQQSIYADRLKVRSEIAAVAKTELEIAKDLQLKGLQTSTRMVTVELREANARSDVLELQTAQVAATSSLTQANLERDNFISQRRQNLLVELQRAEKQLGAAEIDYQRLQEQLALIQAPAQLARADNDLFELNIQISNHLGTVSAPSGATNVMPGDTVIVRVLPIRMANE